MEACTDCTDLNRSKYILPQLTYKNHRQESTLVEVKNRETKNKRSIDTNLDEFKPIISNNDEAGNVMIVSPKRTRNENEQCNKKKNERTSIGEGGIDITRDESDPIVTLIISKLGFR